MEDALNTVAYLPVYYQGCTLAPYDIDTDGDLCPDAKPLTGGMAKDFKEGVQTLINTEFEGFETQVSYDDDDAPTEAGIGVLLPLGVWVNFKVVAVEEN